MKWDLYCAFIEMGCRNLRKEGLIGIIIPSQFLYQDYARLIRKELVNNYLIEIIADFSNVHVFLDATVMTCVIVISKPLLYEVNHLVKVLKPKTADALSDWLQIPQVTFNETPDVTFRLEVPNT